MASFVLKSDLFASMVNGEGAAKLRELMRDISGMEDIATLEEMVETLIGIEIVDEADQIDDMRRLARQK